MTGTVRKSMKVIPTHFYRIAWLECVWVHMYPVPYDWKPGLLKRLPGLACTYTYLPYSGIPYQLDDIKAIQHLIPCLDEQIQQVIWSITPKSTLMITCSATFGMLLAMIITMNTTK